MKGLFATSGLAESSSASLRRTGSWFSVKVKTLVAMLPADQCIKETL
jgi:hypothetical protein